MFVGLILFQSHLPDECELNGQKGMGNLKYLKPSDEGILQFLSNSIEIWSRDQFFHKNQLCYIARVKFLLKKGV